MCLHVPTPIHSFENAAEVAGIKIYQTFEDRYREKLRELQRLWLDYNREIRSRQSGSYPQVPNEHTNTSSGLRFSEDGFPMLPAELDCDSLNKKDLAELLRLYLGKNYCALQ